MQAEILNIGLGFLEGLALIFSPCILPILPIILAGSLTGSKKRPIGIIIGFILTFSLVTFFSRKLLQVTGIDLNIIRYCAYGILLLLAVILISTYLSEKFNLLTQRLTRVGTQYTFLNNSQSGFVGGILFGALVALIWTPCAGPILAAVIVQAVVQQTNVISFLILLAFSCGVAIPMVLIAIFGRSIMQGMSYFKNYTSLLRKILGVVIILSVVYMILLESGFNQTYTLNTTQLNSQSNPAALVKGLSIPYPAPAIGGIDDWINTPALNLTTLKGQVVLIDFWTYSCINCIRTLPYLKDWYEKYHDKGLVIIGVHTPEFDFEKKLTNVKNAVERSGIKYPVALDNSFVTWLNFQNRYWPAHYLIDKNGNVVYIHFGEGEYDVTENNIRYLLGESQLAETHVQQANIQGPTTPETYLGYERAANFASPELMQKNNSARYSYPDNLKLNQWALQGDWQISSDHILATAKNNAIKINFQARNVYMVMGNDTNQPIHLAVILNNKIIKNITVQDHTLYTILELEKAETGILVLKISEPGLQVYTFTFGG
jgi:cytochrome c biogenesis protein CcdA/thiol-disulfide isomerase/thioredoxin